MPACARKPRQASAFALICLLALTACSGSGQGGRFEVLGVETSWSEGRLAVRAERSLTLSSAARNAREHGVPLTIETELSLHELGKRTRVARQTDRFEIRYSPLSDHYQLSRPDGGAVLTFPRLRHVLAELSRMELSVQTGALPAGEYELQIRTRLDRMSMPPPMRLPSQLSAEWQHDSSWTAWPFAIARGT